MSDDCKQNDYVLKIQKKTYKNNQAYYENVREYNKHFDV